MADQISINVTDNIPPINQATIDLNGNTGNTYSKTQLDSWVTSGIKGVATQTNAPTAWVTGDPYLFEIWKVATPLTLPNSWGYAVTQAELDANYVFFDVKNGVVSKSLSKKTHGKDAYQSYLDTTTDSPPMAEAEWSISFAISQSFKDSEKLKAPSGSATFDFVKNEISTQNLFNLKTFKLNAGFDGATGEVIPSNSANGISDLIPVKSETNYGVSFLDNPYFKYDVLQVVLPNSYIVQYDEDKNYLSYIVLNENSTFKTGEDVKFIRWNPNTSTDFKIINNAVIAEQSKFPFGYVRYSEFETVWNNNLDFFVKENITVNSINSAQGFSYANENLKITSGEKTVLSTYLFDFQVPVTYTGKAKFIIKITGEIRGLLPLLLFDASIYAETNLIRNLSSGINQPVTSYFANEKANEFFIVAEGFFTVNDDLRFLKYALKNINIPNEINAKIQCFALYLDENGKPRNTQNIITNNTNISNSNTYNLDPEKIIPSEALYNNAGRTLAGDIMKLVDFYTGEDVNYKQTTKWLDGSNMTDAKVDGVIFIKYLSKYYKRVIADFADVRWFGAKGDGIDSGIGNFSGDHDAINLALRLCKKVKLQDGTFIVKKPIVLNDGNILHIDKSATLKLGIASNCTLLKNKGIDIPNNGKVDGVSYPYNYKFDKYLKITGGGTIDGNALGQFREGSTGQTFGGNPEVDDTPVFRDGDGIKYLGWSTKFADVDLFEIEDITFKDGRTYQMAFGGINHFKANKIRSLRSVHLTNGDGLHAHGQCKLIEINDFVGHSGDDLFAITTMEAGDLSIRIGDVEKVIITNLTETGIDPNATISNPILAPLFNDFNSFGPLRFSVTDEKIGEIIVENVKSNMPLKDCVMLLSNVPNLNTISGLPYNYGNGKIGKVYVKNLRSYPTSRTPIGLGCYTKIDSITLDNIDHNLTELNFEPALIRDVENFVAVPDAYKENEIGVLNLLNITCTKGAQDTGFTGYIDIKAKVEYVFVDNFLCRETNLSPNSHKLFARGNFRNFTITNSKLRMFKLLENTNLNYILMESNNEFLNYEISYVGETIVGTQPLKANTSNLMLNSFPNATSYGDRVLMNDGMYIYVTGSWKKMNN